jgi:hypothetical protein
MLLDYSDVINQAANQQIQNFGFAILETSEPQPMNQEIAASLLAIPSVEAVYVDHHGDIVNVWTVVDDPSEYEFELIYDRELSLIRRFCDHRFDFSTIARKGRDIRSLISLTCPGWRRPTQLTGECAR